LLVVNLYLAFVVNDVRTLVTRRLNVNGLIRRENAAYSKPQGLLLTMPHRYKTQRFACESENAILRIVHGSAASRISVPYQRAVYSPHRFVSQIGRY
jgi:hypothetical protein